MVEETRTLWERCCKWCGIEFERGTRKVSDPKLDNQFIYHVGCLDAWERYRAEHG